MITTLQRALLAFTLLLAGCVPCCPTPTEPDAWEPEPEPRTRLRVINGSTEVMWAFWLGATNGGTLPDAHQIRLAPGAHHDYAIPPGGIASTRCRDFQGVAQPLQRAGARLAVATSRVSRNPCNRSAACTRVAGHPPLVVPCMHDTAASRDFQGVAQPLQPALASRDFQGVAQPLQPVVVANRPYWSRLPGCRAALATRPSARAAASRTSCRDFQGVAQPLQRASEKPNHSAALGTVLRAVSTRSLFSLPMRLALAHFDSCTSAPSLGFFSSRATPPLSGPPGCST